MHYGQVQAHHFVRFSSITRNYGHLKSTRPVTQLSEMVGQDVGVVYVGVSGTGDVNVEHFVCCLVPRLQSSKATEIWGISFNRSSFQVRMVDLSKVQKQGRDENVRKYDALL